MKKSFLAILLLCICLVFTGCGTALYEMTSDEEDQIVLYAAKMVSKFNRQQDKGYSYVTKTSDDTDSSADTTDTETDVAEDTSSDEQTETFSWSDLIGQDGIDLYYTGYEISDSYATDDVAIPDADDGMTYIILGFQLLNTTDQDLTVDLLTNTMRYSLLVNGDTTASGVSTLSMEDLSTYYNESFAAGSVDDVVLIFEISESATSDISSLTLQVTKNGSTYSVNL